jgi:iron(III) transport system permease protein
VVLLEAALSRSWGQGFRSGNFTFENFARLVELPGLRQALVNSALFAGASALLAAIISFAVAYLVLRRKVAIGPLLSFLAMAPYAIPGIVLAIGFFAAFAAPPLSLYGTGLLIVLAFTARFMPITYSSSIASLASLNPEMEDAASILGANRLQILLWVTWPLVRRSLAAAAILVFILASHELSTAVFLVGPTTHVVSISMIELADNGQIEALAAMGITLMALTLACVGLGIRLVGRSLISAPPES